MKEVNGPEEIQARLDRFIDAVDHELDHSHHDAFFSPHAVDSISRVEQERGPDQHKSTTGSAHHVPVHATGQLSYFTSLLLTFAASTSVVLLLLWLFWPAADDILERMPDIREHPQLAPPSQTFATTPSTDEPVSEGDNAEADQSSVADRSATTTSPSVDQPGGLSPANSEAVTARQQQTESLTPASSDKVEAADVVQYTTGKFLDVAVNIAIIRQSPVTGDVVARLKKHTRVRVTGREGEWFHILFSDGRIGWGHKDLFSGVAVLIASEHKQAIAIDEHAEPSILADQEDPARTDPATTTPAAETETDVPLRVADEKNPDFPATPAISPPAAVITGGGDSAVAAPQEVVVTKSEPKETASIAAVAELSVPGGSETVARSDPQSRLPEQGTFNPHKFLTVTANIALIRTSPDHGRIVSRLQKGTVVRVIAREGDWYRIRFPDGRIVWGHKDLFSADDAPVKQIDAPVQDNENAVVSADVTHASNSGSAEPATTGKRDLPVVETAAVVAPATAETAVDHTTSSSSALTPAADAAAGNTFELPPAGVYSPNRFLVVAADIAVMRQSPGQGKVVSRLKRGTMVRVIAREGDWFHIRFPNGRLVWGHKDLFVPKEAVLPMP